MKKNLKMRMLGGILLLLEVILFISFPLFASTKGTLRVEPVRFEFPLPRGYKHTAALTVSNTYEYSIRLKAKVYDFDVDERGNMIPLKASTTPLSCSSWIKFNPREFEVSPGERQVVRFTVHAPKDAIAGEHRCVIIFETPPVAKEGTVAVVLNIGVVVYAAVPEIKRSCKINNIEVYYEKGILEFMVELYNSGNARFRGKGEYKIKNNKGDIIFEDKFPYFTVMPDKVLLIPLEKEIELTSGNYTFSLELKERARGNPPPFSKEINFEVKEGGK
ncbi:hypothetical protein J7K28_06955 [Candidatus Aerophobetes bacterium]|nr:hypothetical protein [Candidatus Aerophobetes bacterium]